jgi:GrpB-like predicted nucleotidyltransferase (UPF0157 family)
MLRPDEIVRFNDSAAPAGASSSVGTRQPERDIAIVPPDSAWPRIYEELASIVASALGAGALLIEHVGSTSVPGLAAKPVIAQANAHGEHVMEYNARKQNVIREIYDRAFRAAGLLP